MGLHLRTWMQEIAGFQTTGRKTLGPGADLVELDDGRGYRHTAVVFHPEYRSHPAIGPALDVILGFLEAPYVTGLLELAASDRAGGAFVYQTGQAWSLAEVVRGLADTGEVGGTRAGLELLYAAGQILVEASDAGAQHGVYAHGGLNPWRVMLKSDGQVEILGYALPQVEVMQFLDDSGQVPTEDSFRYCPPERLEGLEEGLSTDLFSLALVAFELITGKPVYDGLVTEIRRQASRAEGSRRLYAYKDQLQPRVRELLGTCLKGRSEDRFLDGEDFLRAVRTTLAHAEGPSLMEVMETMARRGLRRSTGQALDDGKTQQISREDLAALRDDAIDAGQREAWSPPGAPRSPRRSVDSPNPRVSQSRRPRRARAEEPAPPPPPEPYRPQRAAPPPPPPSASASAGPRRPQRAPVAASQDQPRSVRRSVSVAPQPPPPPAPAAPTPPRRTAPPSEDRRSAGRWSKPTGRRRQRSMEGEDLSSPTTTAGFRLSAQEQAEVSQPAERRPRRAPGDHRPRRAERPSFETPDMVAVEQREPQRAHPQEALGERQAPPEKATRSASDVIEQILQASSSGDRPVEAAPPLRTPEPDPAPASLEEAFGVPRHGFGFGTGLEGPPTGPLPDDTHDAIERTLDPAAGVSHRETTMELPERGTSGAAHHPPSRDRGTEPLPVVEETPERTETPPQPLPLTLGTPLRPQGRTPDLIPPSQGGKGRAFLLKRGLDARPIKTRIPRAFTLAEAVSFLVGNVVPVRLDLQGRLLFGYRLGPESGPAPGSTLVSDFEEGSVLVLHPVPAEEVWVQVEVRSGTPARFRVPVNLAMSAASVTDALAGWMQLPPGRWALRHQERVLSPHLLLAELDLREEPSLVLAR